MTGVIARPPSAVSTMAPTSRSGAITAMVAKANMKFDIRSTSLVERASRLEVPKRAASVSPKSATLR